MCSSNSFELESRTSLAQFCGAHGAGGGRTYVTYDGQKTAVLKPGTYAYGLETSHKARVGASPCVLFIAFESRWTRCRRWPLTSVIQVG
jgi:hypothetical protein